MILDAVENALSRFETNDCIETMSCCRRLSSLSIWYCTSVRAFCTSPRTIVEERPWIEIP